MHMSLNGNAIIPDEELQGSVEPIREVRGKLTGLEFIQGHSAYEVAVINGFIGTEEEWLASLKGKPGKQGPPGTVVFEELTDEQKELLKGKPGKDGEDGVSPAVSVEEIEGGKRISITDANGTKVFDIMDGEDGRGILSIERDDGGEWKVTYEDGEVVKLDAPDVQGAVSYAEAQELTDEQKAQARDNIGAQIADFVITMKSDEDGNLIPDKTWAEATEAHKAGRRLSCVYNSREYALDSFWEGEEAHFVYNNIQTLTEYRIYFLSNSTAYFAESTPDQSAFLVASVNGQTGAVKLTADDVGAKFADLIINGNHDMSEFDKTYTEIEEAYNAGATLVLYRNGAKYDYVSNEDGFIFERTIITDNMPIRISRILIWGDNDAFINDEYAVVQTMPNPYKLKLTGAVTAEYDGSEEVSVEIPKAPELPENIVQYVNGNAPDENGNVTIELPEGGTGQDAALVVPVEGADFVWEETFENQIMDMAEHYIPRDLVDEGKVGPLGISYDAIYKALEQGRTVYIQHSDEYWNEMGYLHVGRELIVGYTLVNGYGLVLHSLFYTYFLPNGSYHGA